MASRWMAPKLAKMARERINPANPNQRPPERPRAGHTIETSNAKSAELAALVEKYTGVVTVCDTGRELVQQGKGKRQANAPFALERWAGRNDPRGGARRGALIAGAQSYDHNNGLIRNGAWVA